MTTFELPQLGLFVAVVEAYRLDRYDNRSQACAILSNLVVEAYRLDRYDNFRSESCTPPCWVVEAYRLDRYDNWMRVRVL